MSLPFTLRYNLRGLGLWQALGPFGKIVSEHELRTEAERRAIALGYWHDKPAPTPSAPQPRGWAYKS